MREKWLPISNLMIRGVTAVARFVLLFFISKNYSTESLGAYSLFYTSISIGILILGLDFYNYSNRQLIYAEDKLNALKDQLVFHTLTYFLLFIPLVAFLSRNFIPEGYLLYFSLILVAEHFSQELYRIFTALSKPVFANVLLFIRTGAWVLMLMALFYLSEEPSADLNSIFLFWLMGSSFSVAAGTIKLLRIVNPSELKPIDFQWIIKGIRPSLIYMTSTLSLIAIDHINKYIINAYCGLDKVGIFSFFQQLSNTMGIIIYAVVIMPVFPKLVEYAGTKNYPNFTSTFARYKRHVWMASIGSGLIMVAGLFPVLKIIGKAEYGENIENFYLLIISNIILNISYIYHYKLYAFHKDFWISAATIVPAVIMLAANFFLIKNFSIIGASISMLVGYSIILFMKYFFSKKIELINE